MGLFYVKIRIQGIGLLLFLKLNVVCCGFCSEQDFYKRIDLGFLVSIKMKMHLERQKTRR